MLYAILSDAKTRRPAKAIFCPVYSFCLNILLWETSDFAYFLVDFKDISYKGQVIPAGTDTINLVGLNLKELIFPWQMLFGFDPILFNQADFKAEKGCYQIFVSWTTSMGQTLSDTVNVFLDLTDTPAPIFTNNPGRAFDDLKAHLFSLLKMDALKKY